MPVPPRSGANRLVPLLRLLCTMPTTPTATLTDFAGDLELSEGTVSRLIRDLRWAGVRVEVRRRLDDGRYVYGLPKDQRGLLKRLGLE